MNINLNPNVTYSDSLMGIPSSHILFNPIAFPSNVNGYQDSSVTAEHIRSSTHPSRGNSSQASAFENPPANGSSSRLPRGHVCPASQTDRESQEMNPSNEIDRIYKCGWIGCTNTEGFKRPACLLRHVKSIHICPGSFKCPHCARKFNRKDKLRSHIQTVHASKGHGDANDCDCRQHC